MRLKVSQLASNHHTEAVTACAWAPTNELFTCSDDKTVCRWNMEGELLGTVATLDTYVTDMHWFPSIGRQVADMFVVSCSDGTFRLIHQTGREEKRVEASPTAAIISLRWSYDGAALVTAGEDGAVKVWSRNGMLRSTLAATSKAIFSVCWGPDNDQILFASGNEIVIKSLQVDRKQLQWKAHAGVVMKADWNAVNNLIVSGGEDRMYKVWDAFGRQLFQSLPFEFVVTTVSWSPNGELFAVGSFDILRLCDKTGWSYSREKTESGSLLGVEWTPDGTQVAAAGANGAVVFGQLINETLSWNNIEVELTEPTHIKVQDVFAETVEELDFRDRVIEMALGYGYLIACTASQCYLYNCGNWNTPHIFDVRAPVNLIIQSDRHFIMVDNTNGVQVYSYDGRVLSNPRFAGIRVEFLNRRTLGLSSDTVAILDKADGKTIRCFDAATARHISDITHHMDIVEIAVSQYATGTAERKVVFIDSNRDMYITPVLRQHQVKLSTMVDSVAWNDVSDTLVALADGKLVTWTYPNVVFVDKDLLPATTTSKAGDMFGKLPQIHTFFGTRVTVRRADGALLTANVGVYPPLLYEFVRGSRWEEAVRLCRFVKAPDLWAALAAMAINEKHLHTAEIALAAINEVDKVHYISYIKDIPSAEGRAAELMLYRRLPEEAEQVLLQAAPPLVYRAIKMNIRLFRWVRALELAVQYKTHVDTVLAYRQRYLASAKRAETIERFLQYSAQVTIDWDAIKAKKAAEKDKERERGSKAAADGV